MAPPKKRRRLSTLAESVPAIDGPGDEEGNSESATPHKPNAQKRSLFVRSLPASATTESLLDYFSQSYPVKHATAVIDRATNNCKGYGFVTFTDAEDALRAVEELNNSKFEGRTIKLEIAEPRHRDVGDLAAGHVAPQTAGQDEAKPPPKKKFEREIQPTPKLIIRNLPWSIKEAEQLEHLFRSYGKVKSATIPKKKNGLMSGFGFVVLRGKKNAEKAIEGVNGKEIDGRTIAVDWAVEKEAWEADKEEHGENNVDESAAQDPDQDDAASSVSDEASEVEQEETSEKSNADIEEMEEQSKQEDHSSTLFIRNLPFTSTDETLFDHFSKFGTIRYARIVMDHGTERPKGTGFVRFSKAEDAIQCLKNAPRSTIMQETQGQKQSGSATGQGHSVLQRDDADLSGDYTMEGRILLVSRAVDRTQAAKLSEENSVHHADRNQDRRRLYLLSEGTISASSPLLSQLSPSEIAMREASFKQRKSLLQSNPSLHLSLTRLSIRNVPRSITSKDLKAMAREAIVGFATDVKAGKRERLSKEELNRGGDDMYEAEKARKAKGKGIVKQAKVVFETREGSKVTEGSGAGRSRGYGFIEYHSHRSALMGLRWLNGHAVDHRAQETGKKGKAQQIEDAQERKKRLIVEFAIENAQVVGRRRDREQKAREKPLAKVKAEEPVTSGKDNKVDKGKKGKINGMSDNNGVLETGKVQKDAKNANRQSIINRKRAMRREKRKTRSG